MACGLSSSSINVNEKMSMLPEGVSLFLADRKYLRILSFCAMTTDTQVWEFGKAIQHKSFPKQKRIKGKFKEGSGYLANRALPITVNGVRRGTSASSRNRVIRLDP